MVPTELGLDRVMQLHKFEELNHSPEDLHTVALDRKVHQANTIQDLASVPDFSVSYR